MFGMHFRPFIQCVVSFVALVVCGCNGSDLPDRGEVSGTVTVDGKPISNLMIVFTPKDRQVRSAGGVTNAEGKYKLFFNSTESGTATGMNAVEFEKPDREAMENSDPLLKTIPQSYFSEFMEFDVKSGQNTVDVDIKTGN